MRYGRRNWRGCLRSSASIRRWGAAGSRGWKGRSMLFKPELNETAKAAGKSVVRSVLRRMVSISITLLILGGLGYTGLNPEDEKQDSKPHARPGFAVPAVG